MKLSKAKGFTLIELCIVVSIIIIVGAICARLLDFNLPNLTLMEKRKRMLIESNIIHKILEKDIRSCVKFEKEKGNFYFSPAKGKIIQYYVEGSTLIRKEGSKKDVLSEHLKTMVINHEQGKFSVEILLKFDEYKFLKKKLPSEEIKFLIYQRIKNNE